MKNIPVKKIRPGIAWFFIVLVLICFPSSGLPKPDTWLNHIHLDKWVHAVLFGMQAFLLMYPVAQSNIIQKRKTYIFTAIAVSVWGLATEFIQKYFIPGREFDLWDWAADTAGVLIALIIVKAKRFN